MEAGVLGVLGPDLINDVVGRFLTAINSGFGFLEGDVARLLNIILILSITWAALMWAFSDDLIIADLARRIIYLGFFVWMVKLWPTLVDTIGRSFLNLGLKAGNQEWPDFYTSAPGDMVELCYKNLEPLLEQMLRIGTPLGMFPNIGQWFLLSMTIVAIVASYFVIAIQIAVSLVTFKLGSLVTFVLLPFGVLEKTAFISERPMGWIVSSGIRLMVLTLVLGVGRNILQQLALPPGQIVTLYDALTIALASLMVMMFSIVSTRLASDLVIGGPSLGVGTLVRPGIRIAQQVSAIHPAILSAVGIAAAASHPSAAGVAGTQAAPRPAPDQHVNQNAARDPAHGPSLPQGGIP